MADMKIKAKEISSKKESLQKPLDTTLFRLKELDMDVLELIKKELDFIS